MIDIVCLGELLFDMIPAETGRQIGDVSSFSPKPGGAPANVAVAIARLGRNSAFIGRVGDDAFGHRLGEVLRLEGVDIRSLSFDQEHKTTLAFIALPDANEPEFLFYPGTGADLMLTFHDVDSDLLHSARVFHFGAFSLSREPCRSAALRAAQVARDASALISFDANYRPDCWPSRQDARSNILSALPLVDLLKVNEVELELLTGRSELRSARELLELGPRACVVTLGRGGSYYQTESQNLVVPSFEVTMIDATGCGDGFMAGLLASTPTCENWEIFISSGRITEALTYANAVGALTGRKAGAIPAFPSRTEVLRFLSEHKK